MTIKLSIAETQDLHPCGMIWDEIKPKLQALHNSPYSLEDAFAADIENQYIIWLVVRNEPTRLAGLNCVIDYAVKALPIYERWEGADLLPREAILAAREYLEGNIKLET